jgi:hypothetical protein
MPKYDQNSQTGDRTITLGSLCSSVDLRCSDGFDRTPEIPFIDAKAVSDQSLPATTAKEIAENVTMLEYSRLAPRIALRELLKDFSWLMGIKIIWTKEAGNSSKTPMQVSYSAELLVQSPEYQKVNRFEPIVIGDKNTTGIEALEDLVARFGCKIIWKKDMAIVVTPMIKAQDLDRPRSWQEDKSNAMLTETEE